MALHILPWTLIVRLLAYFVCAFALMALLTGVVFAEKEDLSPAPAEFVEYFHRYSTWSETCAPYIDFQSKNYDSDIGELTYRWMGSDSQHMDCMEDPVALVGPVGRYVQVGGISSSTPANCVSHFELVDDDVLRTDVFRTEASASLDEAVASRFSEYEHYVWTGPRSSLPLCNNLASLPRIVTEGEDSIPGYHLDPPFEFSLQLLRD